MTHDEARRAAPAARRGSRAQVQSTHMNRKAYLSHDVPALKAGSPAAAHVQDLSPAVAPTDHDALFFWTTCIFAEPCLDAREA